MSTALTMSLCPNCGAPIDVRAGALHVICVYCNKSLAVTKPPGHDAGAVAQLTAEAIPEADVELLKSLVTDGKRDEAIAHYMRAASVPRAEALAAIDAMALDSHAELMKHLPLKAGGVVLYLFIIAFFFGLAGYVVSAVAAPYSFLAILPFIIGVLRVVGFVSHAAATWTSAFGATGNARIVRFGLVREVNADAFLGVVLFEVTPDDGSPSFSDQESVWIGKATRDKLVPGNVIGVRFDGARQHVYMRSPVVVLASGT